MPEEAWAAFSADEMKVVGVNGADEGAEDGVVEEVVVEDGVRPVADADETAGEVVRYAVGAVATLAVFVEE